MTRYLYRSTIYVFCDQLFFTISIFIAINHIISLNTQTCFFGHFCKNLPSGCCLGFAQFFGCAVTINGTVFQKKHVMLLFQLKRLQKV